MKILIVGGAGFLGTNLAYQCVSDPELQVTILDSLDPALGSTLDNLRPLLDRIEFVQGDMRDADLMARLVKGQDAIITCAGQTSHPRSLRLPLLDAEMNCLGNLSLLEAVRQYNPEATIVYASSTTVTGRATTDVIEESHPERPLDIYSANKGVAEKYYTIYQNVHGLKTVVLRFPNIFGPFGKESPEFGFVNYFISRAWAGHDLTIYGEGAQRRDLLFVEDAADLLLHAAREDRLVGDIYFATGFINLSIREIAEGIVDVLGIGQVTQIEWPEVRQRIEVGDVTYSSERLRNRTDWQPQHDFTSGMQKTKAVLSQSEAQ